ncbi:MAG TPA: RHS repeat-associated core domain-containing protein [Pyrinomonadaceae bacterium]|nr:RHS repeat-associated core domain-containing protein [Pyrinomonadaceae bacterium]
MLNIPLGSLSAGRGTSPGYTVSLQYNGKIWDGKQQYKFNGSPDPVHGNIFYTKQLLVQAEDGGWRLNSGGYALSVINSFDPDEANICYEANQYTYAKNGYTYKVQMKMPDGGIVTFRPYGTGVNFADPFDHDFFSIDPTGLRHVYVESVGLGHEVSCNYYPQQIINDGMNYYSSDGSGMRLFIPPGASGVAHWTLYLPDGSKVEYNPADDTSIFERVTDRNGNKVVWKGATLNGLTGIMIQNDVGKYVFVSNYANDVNKIITPGVNGELLETTVHWKEYWVYRKYKATSAINAPAFERYEERPWQFVNVDKITFPVQASSQEYNFTYNAVETEPGSYTEGWGDLKTLILPSGAKAEYAYAFEEGSFVPFNNQMVLDAGVLGRTLTYHTQYDGSSQTVVEKTKYNENTTISPAGGKHFESGSWSQDFFGYNSRIENPDGTVTEKIWAKNEAPNVGGYAVNAYVKTEFTSIPDFYGNPSLTSTKDYDYDKNGNVLEVREYEWVPYSSVPRTGSGITLRPTGLPAGLSLKRKTINTYYNPTPIATDTWTNSPNHYANPDPTAPRLHNIIRSTETRDDSNAPRSRTEFYYDNPSTTGNLKETRMWDSSKGQLNSEDPQTGSKLGENNSISTRTDYDQWGNVVLQKDPKGYQTKITYNSVNGYPGLYATQTETAYGTTIKRTGTATYDFTSGLVTSSTDIDNGLINATEYDALGKPVKTISALGTELESWVRTEYNIPEKRVIVRADLETKGDGKKVSIQHFDELGRVRLSRTLEDSTAQDPYNEYDGVKIQTRYAYDDPINPNNSNGVYTLTSNPYRAATSSAAYGEPTMGWALGYINKTGKHSENSNFSGTSLPAPWGNSTNSTGMVSTDTDTDRILVTDQAGKQRISKTNVLGQLSDVWEIAPPDSAPNSATEPVAFTGQNNIDAGYRTIYTYNVLGSLTKVRQGSQIRSFTYNSLSLLTSAANPESGTTNYQYDANGNLISKIDARGVIVSYAYDALNRVKQRSYSGESGGYSTPMVTYEYDTLPHAKGKLTEINSSISATRYTSFGVKGAVLSSEQTTGGRSFVQNYSYNLSGALVEQTYPDGRRVKSVLKNDGSLSSIESKKNSSAGYWTYASNFSYTPARNLSGLQFGNGHWESADFNSRLQPTRIALGTTQNGTNLLKLDYSYGITGNNGNVLSQAIEVPSNGSEPGFTATQVYAYDSLNRLKDAAETIGGSPSWRQSFVYDRYGNRNFNEELTTTLLKKCGDSHNEAVCESDRKVLNPSANSANNRLAAGQDYVFDAAGNTTADAEGHIFLLDGENKIVQIIENNVVVGKYYYDGDGKRVKKETVGEITVFVYDINGRTIAEYSTAASETPQVAYLTSDALGSPRINTSAGGAVISRHDYHPFGEEISTPQRTLAIGYDSDEVRKKFTGYERDKESGLDFAQERYHNYSLGRFQSPDDFLNSTKTSEPASWNLYVYVRNNPLRFTDPTGEDIENTKNEGHQLSKEKMASIENDLRKKTGLQSIAFDTNGKLTYDPNGKANGGSAQLRRAITGAINDHKNIFQLGDYSNSDINFGLTDAGTKDDKSGVVTYQVKLDFADYSNAKGYSDSEAFIGFTIGQTIYHEIDHKVSYDPNDPIPPGSKGGVRPDISPGPGLRGVIDNDNIVSRELGLAERVPGAHSGEPCKSKSALCGPGVYEIPFKINGKTKYLRWKLENDR